MKSLLEEVKEYTPLYDVRKYQLLRQYLSIQNVLDPNNEELFRIAREKKLI